MSTGTILREARTAASLTQAQLARRAGTSQPAVARYESGVASPSVRTLERLLHAAGCRLTLTVEPAPVMADLGSERMRQLRALRPQIEAAVHAIGARNLRVFGSVARGDDDAESDVDLLVDYDIGAEGLRPLIALRATLADLIGSPVDIAPVEILRQPVAERALAEAVPL